MSDKWDVVIRCGDFEEAEDLIEWLDALEIVGVPAVRSPRCAECGKFRRSGDLRMVYTGGPAPEPDHEACKGGCR